MRQLAVVAAALALSAAVPACGGSGDGGEPTRGPASAIALPSAALSAAAEPTTPAGARATLAGETWVSVRVLPPDAVAQEQLESAGQALSEDGKPITMARTPPSLSAVLPWELVSAAPSGWAVWRPEAIDRVIEVAGGAASVSLDSVEAVAWPDACLGIDQPGKVCAQVITPGYRIVVEDNRASPSQRVEYHTDRNSPANVVRAPAVAPGATP
ncbi:MAG TPA: hypothetical protein VFC53_12370 [Dehalococcoidia bacterium]|nr:hypothetical protein [Dehalococcoidia bacterium]